MTRTYIKSTNYKKDKKITIFEETGGNSGPYPTPPEKVPIKNGNNIWAYYRHATGDEFYAAARENYKVEVVFKVAWRDNIDIDKKILFRGQEYAITRIDDFEGYKNDLTIYAYAINPDS